MRRDVFPLQRFTLALVLIVLAAALAFGQESPSRARGFVPDKVYAAGPIDDVNVFNGNLIVTIPLSQTFVVSPALSYSFKAIHNGKTWDYARRTTQLPAPCPDEIDPPCYASRTDFQAIADETANAGFGWRVQFARFIVAGDLQAHSDHMLVETADGAQHSLYTSLHDGTPTDNAAYTRDGSYLRSYGLANGHTALDTPEGVTYEFAGRTLMGMHDQVKSGTGEFVNRVDIQYGPLEGEVWPCAFPAISQKVVDTRGRTSYVCFQNLMSDSVNQPTVTDVYAAAGTQDGLAHYTLAHAQTSFGRENFYQGLQYLYLSAIAVVPALMSITLPDGSSYGFEYFGTTAHPGAGTGNFASVTLPTKGSYNYSYTQYAIPTSNDCLTDEEWLGSFTAGVSQREERDANGTVVGTTYFGAGMPSHGVEGGVYQCTTEQEGGTGYFSAFSPGAELTTTVVPADKRSKTVRYYSVWPGYNRLFTDSPDGFKVTEYGLPFTRAAERMRDGLFLSSETYLCTDATLDQCSTSPTRATYVQYEVDAWVDHTDISTRDHNARVKKSLTVYFDDVDPATNQPRTSLISNDDFDGLGHYRVSETSGFGATGKRRSSVNFNPASGTYPGGFSMPALTSAWLTNLFTYRETRDLDASGVVLSSARTEACFDSDTGFLNRTRTLTTGTTPGTHDLLAVYEPNISGEVAAEAFYGGDRSPLPAGFHTCTGALTAPEYRITHTYASGALTSTQYDGTSFKTYDVDVHPVTGAVTTSRDPAGVATSYSYDALGRLTAVHPQGQGWTEYEYGLPASSAQVPYVAVRVRPDGSPAASQALTEERFYFDGLGRLIQRKSAMPNNEWATITRRYDLLGRVSTEYTPFVTSSSAFDSSFTALGFTQYTYDELGRVTSLQTPDGKVTTTAYTGDREQDRTSTVATTVNSESAATSKYFYDYLHRLTTVQEKSDTIVAQYGYDIADHLTSVSLAGPEGAQTRSFTYDNRGFLTSETHPESHTTTYSIYDSRGHAWQKRTADAAFDLNFTFDAAERLLQVDGRNPNYAYDQTRPQWRPSKTFSFATANTATNWARGKLASTQRHNYSSLGDIVVSETFQYDSAARVSKKSTAVSEYLPLSDVSKPIQTFEQTFTYDDLGQITSAEYPKCSVSNTYCGPSQLGTLNYTYDHGYLSSVPGFINSISYYPTGVMKQLKHASGVTTDQGQDDKGMARVKRITVSDFGDCAVPVPVITSQPADSSITPGATATLTVTATGSSLSYQWYDAASAQAISGATGSTYVTPSLNQNTSYYVKIVTPCGYTVSRVAVVTVCVPATIDAQPADASISSGATATLTVHATGAPVQYQWYDVTNGQAIAGATSASFTTPALTQTTSYYARASTPCGTPATSRTATVTVCTAPALASQAPNTAVVAGATVTLTANATGTSLHYHWYAGTSPDISSPVGADAPSYTTPAVASTSRYWVQVTNSCGTVNGATLTVTPVVAPLSVTATYADATHISLTWPAAMNAIEYRIMRRELGTTLRPVMTVAAAATTTLDIVASNRSYLYCVQAIDSAGAATPCSAADIGSTVAFSTIVAARRVYAADYQQILDGINAVYDITGWAHATWTSILPPGLAAPAANVPMDARHVTSLRNALLTARVQAAQSSGVGMTALAFSDPQLASGTPIRAVHLQELQGGLR